MVERSTKHGTHVLDAAWRVARAQLGINESLHVCGRELGKCQMPQRRLHVKLDLLFVALRSGFADGPWCHVGEPPIEILTNAHPLVHGSLALLLGAQLDLE